MVVAGFSAAVTGAVLTLVIPVHAWAASNGVADAGDRGGPVPAATGRFRLLPASSAACAACWWSAASSWLVVLISRNRKRRGPVRTLALRTWGSEPGRWRSGPASRRCCTVPLVVTVTADAATDMLLSKGRPVLASTTHGAPYSARAAVDGDATTRWASPPAPAPSGCGSIWAGRSRSHGSRLRWERAYAAAYRVQISADAASWTDLVGGRRR